MATTTENLIDYQRDVRLQMTSLYPNLEITATCRLHAGHIRGNDVEFIFKTMLQHTSADGVVQFLYDSPVKIEIVRPTSFWQVDCLWRVFVMSLRVFRMPLEEMPLLINDSEELIRHYVSWRLEKGI